MEQYPILKQPIQHNNPGEKISPTLLVWHSTDNPNTTAQNHFHYWNDSEVGTSANYVSDWVDIIELIPAGYKSWNCGPNANSISIGCELCETDDPTLFLESLKRARFLTQTILKQYPNIQIVSHAWITQNLGGTTHMDPISYLQSHNWTWDMFLAYITDDEGADKIVEQWKQDIMDQAGKKGLLDPALHNADEPATKWFVSALALRLLDKIESKG